MLFLDLQAAGTPRRNCTCISALSPDMQVTTPPRFTIWRYRNVKKLAFKKNISDE